MTMHYEDLDTALADGMGLSYHAARQPNSLGVVSNFGERTYLELNQRTNQLVRYLRAQGLNAGSPIAVVLRNRPEFIEALSAATRGGYRFTPVNYHLNADEVSYILNDCEAEAVIYDAGLGSAAGAIEQLQNCSVRLAVGGHIDACDAYEDCIGTEEASDIEDPVHGTAMFYTSGTTGKPKGVNRKGQPSPSSASAKITGESPETVSLCTGPMYHGAPFSLNVTTPLNAGSKLVLMDRWDAEETLVLIERHRVTHTHMVATMFHRLLQLPQSVKDRYDISSLRKVFHGAAPCPVHVKRDMIDWFGPVIWEYFSATEGGSIYMIDSETWLRKPGSVGKSLLPGTTKILGPDGEELKAGETGTIYFKAPEKGRFEYFKAEQKTADAYVDDWFTLGDMGYFDEEGFLFLNGRSAETIISGGVNIYPQEIDDVLLQHSAVFDVCTVGVPSEEWGEEVKAVVQLVEGVSADEATIDSILDCARVQLPSFKRPRSIDFVDDLPRLSSGKVKRNAVRARYWEKSSRSI